MNKKEKSSYSKAVRITCIILAGLTILGISASAILYILL